MRARRLIALAAVAGLLGCEDGFYYAPAPQPTPLLISMSLSAEAFAALGSPQSAFDKVDGAEIWINVNGEQVANQVLSTDPVPATRTLELTIPLLGEVTLAIGGNLLVAGEEVFHGSATATVTAGETVQINIPISPVVDGIVITPGEPAPLEIDETLNISALAFFDSGDDYPGATINITSLSPSVVSVGSQSGGSAVLTAEGPGTAIIQASATRTVATGATTVSNSTVTESIEVDVVAPDVEITTSTLPDGVVETPYSAQLEATGGAGPGTYSWAISEGSLPPGLGLNATSGIISGTPTAIGSFGFEVQASSAGQMGTRSYIVSINPNETCPVPDGPPAAGALCPGVVMGQILDFLTLDPITGASIFIEYPGDYGSYSLSAGNGMFMLEEMPIGTYQLTAMATGYRSNTATFDINPETWDDLIRLDFALPPSESTQPVANLAGRVFNDSWEPLPGAVVQLSGGEQTNGVFKSTVADEYGTFTFPGVVLIDSNLSPISSFTLIASAEGRATQTISGIMPANNTSWANFNFALAPAGPIDTYFTEGFEGGFVGWTTSGFWNCTDGTTSSPAGGGGIEIINTAVPTYVSLAPDDASGGALPPASEGMYYAWYGQPSTGNFIGVQSPYDFPLSGGSSTGPNSGYIMSPLFEIPSGANQATLTFDTWFEIESVNPNEFGFDLMTVYVLDGEDLIEVLRLNPSIDPELPDRGPLPFSSGGFNRAPVIRPASAPLDPFIGKDIFLIFEFETLDSQYNGFRGWGVDNISVNNGPYIDVGPPPNLAPRPRPERRDPPVRR